MTHHAPSVKPGRLERWARFSHRRRGSVIGVWFLLLVGVIVANVMFGGTFVSEFKLPGSESQKAADLLKSNFPARSGESADLVFEAPAGITDPAANAKIADILAHVAAIPGIASIDSPLEQTRLISRDGTIARAEVNWSTLAAKIKKSDYEKFIKIVDDWKDPALRVEAGGRVVEANDQQPFGNEFIGLAFAVLILLVAFGSVIAMGLPLGASIFGLGAGFSVIGLAARFASFPDFSPQFAAMIGLGVGIDYSLLVVTRFREGLHGGRSVEDSIVLALTTAGRSVMFAGLVVALSFMGLFIMGLPFVAALGTSGAIVVVLSVLVAITLMPAFLSLVGKRVDNWRVPFLHNTEGVDPKSVWYRLSERIQRHPLPYAIVATVILLTLASPLLSMRLGFTDAGNSPTTAHIRRAYDLIAKGFGPGSNGGIFVVADVSKGGKDQLPAIREKLEATEDVVKPIGPIVFNPAGDTALIILNPVTSPQDKATTELIHLLRDTVIPNATRDTGAKLYVTGAVAGNVDAGDRISSRMPLLFGGVIGVSFILLMIVFRSVLVALKAAIMNLLSIGAAYGVVVAIFQWGWFSGVLGIQEGPIETFLPMMMFAILFGLSMDYEVFLISRVREEYLQTRNNATAVSHGLAATARVITAAAAIMVTVFLTFVLGDERVIKEFGIGLATAIFVDATVVRMFLVPATMELLGDRNWWMPRWLDRILPNVNVDGPPEQLPPVGAAAGGK